MALKKAKKESLAEAVKVAASTTAAAAAKLASSKTQIKEPTKSGDSSPSEPKHIIVEIEDERIKSQLIANAMKKAISKGKKGSKSSGISKVENNVVIMKASDALKAVQQAANNAKLPPKKRARETHLKAVHERKKPKILKVVSDDSDSESDSSSEEEIEEITTEGARANGCTVASNNNTGAIAPGAAGVGASNTPGNNPMALKTEMNKVDVIVDGRSVA